MYKDFSSNHQNPTRVLTETKTARSNRLPELDNTQTSVRNKKKTDDGALTLRVISFFDCTATVMSAAWNYCVADIVMSKLKLVIPLMFDETRRVSRAETTWLGAST
jgi:hypothetical protein